MSQSTRLSFPPAGESSFYPELKAAVADYFASRRLSSHANAEMVLKTAVLFAIYFGGYGLLLWQGQAGGWPLWALWLITFVMGIGMAGIGFAVAHDAVHGAYSAHPWVNRLLGFSMNLIGGSAYVWSITHNLVHHTYTNVPDSDEDLEVAPVLRLSRTSPWWPIHRYQHLFGWLLYGFATLFWVFIKDYRKLAKPTIGPYVNKKHPPRDLAVTLGGKLLYYLYTIVIPLLVLDVTWWQFAIGYLTMHFTAGIILGVVFQMAHTVEGPEQPVADADGRLALPWAEHQLATTADFAHGNRWLSWYVGGLNYQVVHHLFPKVCSVHYPALSGLVAEVAARHGLTYHRHPTLGHAIASHYRTLVALGRPPAGSVAQPKASRAEARLSPL